MRILWYSTAPYGPSSYSVLTRRTVPDIIRDGHEVVIYSWYGLQGQAQKWPIQKRGAKKEPAGVATILPHCGSDPYGIDTAEAYYKAVRPDVMITNMDVWVMPTEITQDRPDRPCKFAPWLPIDHDPIPRKILESLSTSQYTMCYSQWGTDLLKANKIDAHFVPCSADASVFRPMPRDEARKALGIDKDKFLVSMVAANKDPHDRKGFAESLEGFGRFAESHDDAQLYVHTNWFGPVNIANLAERCGLKPHQVLRHDQLAYLSGQFDDGYMRAVYSASDVLLNCAKSEGFGLPILEAQMCGTPVAISDFSTSRELLSAGWLIEGQKSWTIGADSWRMTVYIDAVVGALEQAYNNRDNEGLRKQARAGAIALDTYEVHKRYWQPALRDIEAIVCGAGEALKLVTF